MSTGQALDQRMQGERAKAEPELGHAPGSHVSGTMLGLLATRLPAGVLHRKIAQRAARRHEAAHASARDIAASSVAPAAEEGRSGPAAADREVEDHDGEQDQGGQEAVAAGEDEGAADEPIEGDDSNEQALEEGGAAAGAEAGATARAAPLQRTAAHRVEVGASTNLKDATSDKRKAMGPFHVTLNTPLYGGAGDQRGYVNDQILINPGIRKTINVKRLGLITCVYTWNASITRHPRLPRKAPDPKDPRKPASGWVQESRVYKTGANGKKHVGVPMPTVLNPPRPMDGHAYHFKNTPSHLARYGKYKVSLFHKAGEPQRSSTNIAEHYMPRHGAVNMSQSVPGQGPGLANDTLTVKGPSVLFRTAQRASDTREYTRLYYPAHRTVKKSGKEHRVLFYKKSKIRMPFVYGQVNGRFGWVTSWALRRFTVGR